MHGDFSSMSIAGLAVIALAAYLSLWPIPKAYGHAQTQDRLYIQSLHAKGLGWMPR
jgi:hypothetical protein